MQQGALSWTERISQGEILEELGNIGQSWLDILAFTVILFEILFELQVFAQNGIRSSPEWPIAPQSLSLFISILQL